jgi:hypothetical protein
MIVETLATISADGSTDVEINTEGYEQHPEGLLQIDVTGTITIQVLGSLDGSCYVEILAALADTDQLSAIALVPYLRFTASATSGGTAVIKLGRNGPRP